MKDFLLWIVIVLVLGPPTLGLLCVVAFSVSAIIIGIANAIYDNLRRRS